MNQRVRLSPRGKADLAALYRKKTGVQACLYLGSLNVGAVEDPFERADGPLGGSDAASPYEWAAVDVDEMDGSRWQLQFARKRGGEEIVLLKIAKLSGRRTPHGRYPDWLRKFLGW